MRRLSMLLVLTFAAACVRNPVSGKRELSLVSEAQEVQLGKEAAQQINQTMPLVGDPQVQTYIANLGKQMAAQSERPNLPWEFRVVDDATVNAFALPGGFIYVTRGLMTFLNDDAQLAAVMGHEIGHVTARHSASQLTKAQLAQVGLGVGMIFSPTFRKYGQLAGIGAQLMFLKFGRDDERQSDELGFKYMLDAGYDVRAMPRVFQTLDAASKLQAGAGKLPEWLSTHPDPENRVEAAVERVRSVKVNFDALKANREEYLQRLEGMVFGENPRQGFFRGPLFLHPDLQFQIQFPQGWQTQNLPQVVAAGSPEQDAIIQLALAGKEPPDAAAQKFLTQQGVAPGQVARETINGMPAVSATFAAQTEQGVLEGLTTFIQHDGSTFQILGLTMQGGLGKYGNVFRSTAATFARLTDPSALNVQPAKVELVKLPSEMTFEQFLQQYPSTQPPEVIAVINSVQPGARIPAGTTLKRVVGGVPPGK